MSGPGDAQLSYYKQRTAPWMRVRELVIVGQQSNYQLTARFPGAKSDKSDLADSEAAG